MNITIPYAGKHHIVKTGRVPYERRKHYLLGWQLGHFIFRNSTGAFIKGLRAFMNATLAEQNRPEPPGFGHGEKEGK